MIIFTIVFYFLFQQHVPCLLVLWNFHKCLLMSKSRVLSKKYHFGRTQAHLFFISFHCPQFSTAPSPAAAPRPCMQLHHRALRVVCVGHVFAERLLQWCWFADAQVLSIYYFLYFKIRLFRPKPLFRYLLTNSLVFCF